jgi:hypothetical protein
VCGPLRASLVTVVAMQRSMETAKVMVMMML